MAERGTYLSGQVFEIKFKSFKSNTTKTQVKLL